jgi:heterodisulfide reductase subunit A-like polyferredoxin
MADLGIANVVARSAFINQVDEVLCLACGDCVSACSFKALSLAETAQVDGGRCVGCGVCVLVCPDSALALVRRPEEEIRPTPPTHAEWQAQRAQARQIDIRRVL